MDDKGAATKIHARRRSNSTMQAAGSNPPSYKTSTASIPDNDGKIIQEEASDRSSRQSWSSDMEMDNMRSDEEELADDDDDDEETGLTKADRKKRRRRKRRNTQLDERVVGNPAVNHSNEQDVKAEQKLVTASLLRHTLINVLLIALWYSFSISISVYNKWMFSKDNLNFHYPLFTTCVHMLVQFSLASLVLFFFPRFRPSNGNVPQTNIPPSNDTAGSYSQLDGTDPQEHPKPPPAPKAPLMTKWFYLTRISPCGTATALDIGLGNFSLRFISLTFFTMCKSSVLAFVLLFALIFRLEKPSWRLGGIITLMTAGVIMMVAGETAFNALGFVLVMTASFCSGFRWSLTQILLLRNPATGNPFSSIFFLTPVMFLALLILALPIEGPTQLMEGLKILTEAKGTLLGVLLLLFPGFLAFMMVAAEFALLKRSSVVTLSVCGIFKEVLTISAAGAVFGDELSPVNVSGLVVTICSIGGYNWLKWRRMREAAEREVGRVVEGEGEGGRGKSGGAEGGEGEAAVGLLREEVEEVERERRGGGESAEREETTGERSSPPVSKRPEYLD
ncbi:hypothetical protein MBLNU230_g7324t1 [Neophaeotheca triangularis]